MRRLALSVGFALLALLPGALFAYVSPGAPTGYVNDFARVLNPDTVAALNEELTAFHASTSNEIAVVVVQDMDGDYIENFAVKLFEEWGIGTRDTDNGVLLLLAIDERKLRIEVGYGLEGALPDSVAQRIINNDMTPLLQSGDYDAAVTAGVHTIMAATQGEYSASVEEPFDAEGFLALIWIPILALSWLGAILARSKSWWAGGIVGAVAGAGVGLFFSFAAVYLTLITVGLGMFGLLLDFIVSNAYKAAGKTTSHSVPWWAGGGTSSWGSSSSSGGFGGFGGGSSGGGGASGSW